MNFHNQITHFSFKQHPILVPVLANITDCFHISCNEITTKTRFFLVFNQRTHSLLLVASVFNFHFRIGTNGSFADTNSCHCCNSSLPESPKEQEPPPFLEKWLLSNSKSVLRWPPISTISHLFHLF